MKDELPYSKLKRRSLDERFKAHPQSYARLQAIADMMEESIAEGCSADEAEDTIEQIQKLGQTADRLGARGDKLGATTPEGSKRKKAKWYRPGGVEVWELLRLGRRVQVCVPFVKVEESSTVATPTGCSGC
jgi:hypothetical protein